LPGKVQAENAALAISALRVISQEIEVGEDAIRNGLANLKIPGRFEKICDQPPFIIDGAHTPESLALCIETFCSLYDKGGVLLFGCAADKDAAAMAKIACLSPCDASGRTHFHFAKIIITTPGTFKISDPVKIYEAFMEEIKENVEDRKIILIKNTEEAIKQAIEYAETQDLPILGTGSFYLVSEIRNFV
jgi:dihydrofolate synthase/folylpolyglutamate synthase